MNEPDKRKVYCSGPLFCPEETAGMEALARTLEEAGYATFLPQRDGLEAYVMRLVDTPLSADVFGSRAVVDRAIFALDVFQIVEVCDLFVANLNGRVPDEGALVEAAIAFAAGKPVVLYKNDRRSAFAGRDNSMIVGLTHGPVVDRLSDLPRALQRAGNRQPPTTYQEDAIPPRVLEVLAHGRRIWRTLQALGGQRDNTVVPDALVQAIRDGQERPGEGEE